MKPWKGTAEDGSVGFDLEHNGGSLGAVTFRADGAVEVVITKTESLGILVSREQLEAWLAELEDSLAAPDMKGVEYVRSELREVLQSSDSQPKSEEP